MFPMSSVAPSQVSVTRYNQTGSPQPRCLPWETENNAGRGTLAASVTLAKGPLWRRTSEESLEGEV